MSWIPAPTSIRGRLTSTLLLGVGIMTLTVALVLDSLVANALVNRFDQDLMNRAEALITLTKEFDEGIDFDFAGEFMPHFENPSGTEYFELWLPDGSLLERSESLARNPLPVDHHFAPTGQVSTIQLAGIGRCRLYKRSFLPQMEDADVEGQLDATNLPERAVTILVARQMAPFDHLIQVIRLAIWGSLTLLLSLTIVWVRMALERGLRPLHTIRNQVMDISPADMDSRVSLEQRVRELDPVVDQLNSLLDRLSEAINRERRFTGDVAHELRTPLAELRSLAQIGQTYPEDRQMVMGFFQDVHEITQEMQGLTENLLALSRLDSGMFRVTKGRVDLSILVQKAWHRVADQAKSRAMTLRLKPHKVPPIDSDHLLVTQIIQNLISNSVAHAPETSTTTVTLTASSTQVFLTITNPAPDLVEADLSHISDRFWQKDRARTGGKHAGLGLALVTSFSALLDIGFTIKLSAGNLTANLVFAPFREDVEPVADRDQSHEDFAPPSGH